MKTCLRDRDRRRVADRRVRLEQMPAVFLTALVAALSRGRMFGEPAIREMGLSLTLMR